VSGHYVLYVLKQIIHRPAYLPPRWSAHVHPEGQLYFFRHAPLRVVTESHLYSTQTLYKIISCIKRVEELLSRQRIAVTDRMELFLELSSDECLYYLIDDSSRTVFWPEAVDTESVGLPDSVSASHLSSYFFPSLENGLPIPPSIFRERLRSAVLEPCRTLPDAFRRPSKPSCG
jgi:hypothetical protein